MTIQQLKYIVEVADKGSISEAAKSLFISQPSLSNAIKELESEMKITLFTRNNKGIVISNDGSVFLGYARQVLQQVGLLEEKYLNSTPSKQHFSVSAQHYAFTADAFVKLIKEFGTDEYEFSLRETKINEIIDDVRNFHSELGIIHFSSYNEHTVRKLLRKSDLVFKTLFVAKPHIFVYGEHPLANKKSVTLEDLEVFPCLNFEKSGNNSFYSSEDILGIINHKKRIIVNDRVTVINLMIGVNAFTISIGELQPFLYKDDIISIPLEFVEEKHIGVITRKDYTPTKLGEIYLTALQRIADAMK